MSTPRRHFLRQFAAGSAITPLAASALGQTVPVTELARRPLPAAPKSPNEKIRIATIGMGIIGFIDTDTALKVPGVELVAVADAYSGRRTHAQEVYGKQVTAYGDYREILDRKDIDAVLVCTPDHWHSKMAVEAMKAGKAVYCEKPMVQKIGQGADIIATQKATGAVFQVGSQYASSIVYDKVRDLISAGAIGKINSVEARYNRNSSIGAWQYSIPTDASAETCDWDKFLGDAPKIPFDPTRFFRWRNYKDYGTAVAGDLFVHLLTGIHHATSSQGPNRVAGFGGTRYWTDGRDVPDFVMALYDYPQTEKHGSFTVAMQCNFADGGGPETMFRFVGSEGVISVTFTDLTLTRLGMMPSSETAVLKGYNSVTTFSADQQSVFGKKWRAEHPPESIKTPKKEVSRFAVPAGYNERLDHFNFFFQSVREKTPVYEDATFGLRAAAPALLANESIETGKVLGWDPATLAQVQA